MRLVFIIAVPFAAVFLGGAALAWCAGERLLRFVRHAWEIDE